MAATVEDAVDIELLQQQKENIQPLAQGRSASKLTSLFASDRRALEQQLKEGHQRFKDEIEAVEARADDEEEDEDRLDVYHRYIRWTLESYPSGPSHASHLVPLLEQATRRFAHDARYKADLRYLRLWILYAKYVDGPRDIYRFLNVNEIGTAMASLYEEWAGVEEAARNFKEADAIYQLGIARRAEPTSRLRKRRDAFQARMLLPQERSASPVEPSLSASTSSRPVLGGLGLSASTGASKPVNGARSFAVFSDAEPGSTGESDAASWDDVGTVKSRKQENDLEAVPWVGEKMPLSASTRSIGRIEVFRDEDAPVPTSVPSSRSGDDILSRSIRGPTDADLLRSNPFRNYTSPVDLGPDAPAPPPLDVGAATASKPVKSRSKAISPAPKPSEPANKGKDDKRERVAVRLGELYPADEPGVEYSIEELIARRRKLRSNDPARQQALHPTAEWADEAMKTRGALKATLLLSRTLTSLQSHSALIKEVVRTPSLPPRTTVESKVEPILQDPATGAFAFAYLRRQAAEEQAERNRLRVEAEAAAAKAAANAATAAELRRQRDREAREAAEQERVQRETEQRREEEERRRPAPPSPTINTKAALAEVDDMFGSTMHFADQSPRRASSDDADGEDEGDETVDSDDATVDEPLPATQSQPGDFVDNSFWGPLASQQSVFSQPSQPPSQVPSLPGFSDAEEETESETERADLSTSLPSRPTAPAFKPVRRPLTTDENARPPLRAAESSDGALLAAEDEALAEAEFEEDEGVEQSVLAAPERKPSRFAPFMDVMTPITEQRTLEYAAHSRASVGITGVPMLVEEDEDEDEGEETEDNEALDEMAAPSQPLPSERGSPASADASTSSSRTVTRHSLNGRPSATLDLPDGLTIPLRNSDASSLVLVDRTDALTLHDDRLDPFAASTLASIIALYPVPDDLVELRPAEARRLGQLQRMAKRKPRRSSNASRAAPSDDDEDSLIELGDDLYSIREKLGEGAYGAVFRLAATTEHDDEGESQFALKVERPCNLWEFSVLHEIHSRLANDRAATSIIAPRRLYAYNDESFLLLQIRDQGTLLDAVNRAASAGVSANSSAVALGPTGLDEVVTMFFVVELLRTVDALHRAGFVHGDLKIDNALVRLTDVPGGNARGWSAKYSATGDGGWRHKGLALIDFGRCIDISAFSAGARFSVEWEVDATRDCAEMVRGESWTYEPDYHGIATIAHTLLFGRRLATAIDGETGRIGLERGALKRYHQTSLWTPLFDALLNPRSIRSDGSLPITDELSTMRSEMEGWLEANADKAGRPSLKALLKKLEIAAMSL